MNSREILNLTKKGLLTWKKNWLFNKYTTHDYGLNICVKDTWKGMLLCFEGVEIERNVADLYTLHNLIKNRKRDNAAKLQRQKLAEKLANINQAVLELELEESYKNKRIPSIKFPPSKGGTLRFKC
jgi:hypothetical protein